MKKIVIIGVVGVIMLLVWIVDLVLSYFDADFLPWYLSWGFAIIGGFMTQLAANSDGGDK